MVLKKHNSMGGGGGYYSQLSENEYTGILMKMERYSKLFVHFEYQKMKIYLNHKTTIFVTKCKLNFSSFAVSKYPGNGINFNGRLLLYATVATGSIRQSV